MVKTGYVTMCIDIEALPMNVKSLGPQSFGSTPVLLLELIEPIRNDNVSFCEHCVVMGSICVNIEKSINFSEKVGSTNVLLSSLFLLTSTNVSSLVQMYY